MVSAILSRYFHADVFSFLNSSNLDWVSLLNRIIKIGWNTVIDSWALVTVELGRNSTSGSLLHNLCFQMMSPAHDGTTIWNILASYLYNFLRFYRFSKFYAQVYLGFHTTTGFEIEQLQLKYFFWYNIFPTLELLCSPQLTNANRLFLQHAAKYQRNITVACGNWTHVFMHRESQLLSCEFRSSRGKKNNFYCFSRYNMSADIHHSLYQTQLLSFLLI